MTSFDYVESQYRFTSPIRYFKANDPIYYEVDNIPLKQLHENDLWLKDQIFNLKLSTEGGINRQDLNELRPYVNESDNIVKVKPGRFTARINDAYSINPLQVIQKITGTSASSFNTWTAGSISSPEIANILQNFKQAVAINLNGLAERAFTRPAFIPDNAEERYTSYLIPRIDLMAGTEADYGQPPYPGVGAVLWGNFNDPGNPAPVPIPSTSYVIRQYDDTFTPTIGFGRLGAAETAFIKRWRGVARTAVVDVAEELSIDIPRFNDEDFFYYNEQGQKIYLDTASQRIDLLFIYSKPVDVSSVTIAKYISGGSTTITKPQLGIVYGAGLGVNFKQTRTRLQEVLDANGIIKNFPSTDDSTLPDGTMKMLAHFGDALGQNTGFGTSGSTIRGSFPSPDDLMNLSPLLDESLGTSSIGLIGQTVLPIAYIVVRKFANLNQDGVPIISSNDVIDIRPFFRTTELSYNERAGIAAAVPSLSIANPVVTQAELDFELKKVRTDVINRIPTIPDIPRPTYTTFYYESEKTFYLEQEILLKQGNAIPDNWGTKNNPQEIIILPEYVPNAPPLIFPPATNEPTRYRRYCKELIFRAEGMHIDGDANPTYLFVGLADANTRLDEVITYSKGAVAGTWIRSGNAQNGGGRGGVPGSINTFSLSFNSPGSTFGSFGSDDSPPQIPFITKSFLTLLDLVDGSDGRPVFASIGAGTSLIYFKLYLIGYKIVEVSRFKVVTLDS